MYIRLENVSKEYNINKKKKITLSNINLTIEKDEFICIVGPSGCGKTVLINLIAGFEKPSSGEIFIDDKKVENPSRNAVTIFQDYSLLPWRTVRKNIELGLESDKNKMTKEQRYEIVSKYIEMVGLREFENYRPQEISGGMKQRVAIARALAVDPDIIFMDEPFGALDSLTKIVLQNKLVDILQKSRKTVIFITHNVEEAIFLADRVVVMQSSPGKIKEIVDVDLHGDRDRGSSKFINIREKVTDMLLT